MIDDRDWWRLDQFLFSTAVYRLTERFRRQICAGLHRRQQEHQLMQRLAPTRPPTFVDLCWQIIYRLGFPIARTLRHLYRPRHEGTLVAIYAGEALLLLRSSYRAEWNFPGGTVHRGETPEGAALRELFEEIGVSANRLQTAGSVCGMFEGRRDHVHFFELRLDRSPELRLDNREIISARLVLPAELKHMPLTGPVIAYLREDSATARASFKRCVAVPDA